MKKNNLEVKNIPLTPLVVPKKNKKNTDIKPFMDDHYSKQDKWFLNYVKNLNLKQK